MAESRVSKFSNKLVNRSLNQSKKQQIKERQKAEQLARANARSLSELPQSASRNDTTKQLMTSVQNQNLSSVLQIGDKKYVPELVSKITLFNNASSKDVKSPQSTAPERKMQSHQSYH